MARFVVVLYFFFSISGHFLFFHFILFCVVFCPTQLHFIYIQNPRISHMIKKTPIVQTQQRLTIYSDIAAIKCLLSTLVSKVTKSIKTEYIQMMPNKLYLSHNRKLCVASIKSNELKKKICCDMRCLCFWRASHLIFVARYGDRMRIATEKCNQCFRS